MAAETASAFDPRAMLQSLETHRVAYVVIGALARVIHGTDEITDGLDMCPRRTPENAGRLVEALDALGVSDSGELEDAATAIIEGEVIRLATRHGLLQIVPVPTGTRGGWNDLRRHANREPLGAGLRIPVAALEDLTRMSAALGRPEDVTLRQRMRHLQDLDRIPGVEL